jgi:hypothetical protein
MQHAFANALTEDDKTAYINFVPPNLVVELGSGERLMAPMPPGIASVARAINAGKYPELIGADPGATEKPEPGAL